MKHLYARAHFTHSPAVPGLNGVCGPSLSGAGMAFAGDPRYGPLAIPLRRARLASGRPCRRLSGGRMIDAAVLHLLRADKSAGLAVHVKRRVRSHPRRDGRHSCRPASLRQSSFRLLLGIEEPKETRLNPFHGRGRRPKADHVGFLIAVGFARTGAARRHRRLKRGLAPPLT